MASLRLTWPSMLLAQVGALESVVWGVFGVCRCGEAGVSEAGMSV